MDDTASTFEIEDHDEDLWQLVYASAASKGFQTSDLDKILSAARKHNSTSEITGILLFVDPSFLQVLEGSQTHIDSLYEQIRLDPRHTHTVLLLKERIEQRSFADWTMGASKATIRNLEEAIGINDFFEDREPLHHLGDTKLRKVLELFRTGSYRQRLT